MSGFELVVPKELDKTFKKLAKRDRKHFDILSKILLRILEDPLKFKPLRGDLKGARRVHVGKSFVLVYEIEDNLVRLLDYDHHDKIY